MYDFNIKLINIIFKVALSKYQNRYTHSSLSSSDKEISWGLFARDILNNLFNY